MFDIYKILDINYHDDDLWLESIEILCDGEELSLTVDTDVNGNTINYKMNNYNLLEYEWTNGRQLSAIYYADEETGESVCVARMTYDENGMRTSKTTEGVTTYYTYQGDKLLSQYQQDENGNIINVMIFLYDEEDNIVGVNYKGIFYYYVYDTQGNVISIYDKYGTSSMSYQYDAWGRIRTIYDSGCPLYNVNPITYRGYYYDNDLGLYYLQSRYYEPGFGRFINSDDPQIALETKEETDGTNLFAYCCNDPVNNVDPSGCSSNVSMHDILKSFLTSYLLKGKKITKYSHFVKDEKQIYQRDVYFKKSKKNTNKLAVTMGYKSAWKKSKTWSSNTEKNSGLINNYYSRIKGIMTSSGTISAEQAEKNKADIISTNVCMVSVLIASSINAAKISSKYNKAWGKKGKDPKNKQKYVLIRITKEKGLNGWYLFKYSTKKVVKI